MTQANLLLVEGTFMDKRKALGATLSKIDGNGSIMWLGRNKSIGLGMLAAIEPEAEFFEQAKQVDLTEKAFHDAVARRNEAQIAYLREPSIITHVAFEGAKTAEAVALEIFRRRGLLAGRHARHDGKRAQAEGVICFDERQARRQHRRRHLATLRAGNGDL